MCDLYKKVLLSVLFFFFFFFFCGCELSSSSSSQNLKVVLSAPVAMVEEVDGKGDKEKGAKGPRKGDEGDGRG